MCTITLELSDELAAIAEKQGLLSPLAVEAYIRNSAGKPVFSAANGIPKGKPQSTYPAPSLDETLDKLWDLCKGSNLTVDRFLEMQRKDKELEDKLDPWTTRLTPAR